MYELVEWERLYRALDKTILMAEIDYPVMVGMDEFIQDSLRKSRLWAMILSVSIMKAGQHSSETRFTKMGGRTYLWWKSLITNLQLEVYLRSERCPPMGKLEYVVMEIIRNLESSISHYQKSLLKLDTKDALWKMLVVLGLVSLHGSTML